MKTLFQSKNNLGDQEFNVFTTNQEVISRSVAFDFMNLKILIYGFVYEIFIDDQRFILDANKPIPIIFHEESFYFPSEFTINNTSKVFTRIKVPN